MGCGGFLYARILPEQKHPEISKERNTGKMAARRTRRRLSREKHSRLTTALIWIGVAVVIGIIVWYVAANQPEPAAEAEQQAEIVPLAQMSSGAEGVAVNFSVRQGSQARMGFGLCAAQTSVSENAFLYISRPRTTDDEINTIISEKVAELSDRFEKNVQRSAAPGRSAELNTEYECYIANNALVGILFQSTEYAGGTSNGEVYIDTLNIDLARKRVLDVSGLFKMGGLEKLATLCRSAIEASLEDASELIINGITASEENYKNIVLGSAEIRVYFEQYQVLPGSYGIVEVSIPYNQIAGLMTVDGTAQYDGTLTDESAASYDPQTETAQWAAADPEKPMIALTFEDGPDEVYTKAILDALAEHGGRGTFFAVGNRIRGREGLLKRMRQMGCEVGAHAYAHIHMEAAGSQKANAQLRSTMALAEKITGTKTVLARPTCGDSGEGLDLSLPIVLWDFDAKGGDMEAAMAAGDGAIVRMGDASPEDARAAIALIEQYAAQGYQLVTVSELFAAKGITPEAGKRYNGNGEIGTGE